MLWLLTIIIFRHPALFDLQDLVATPIIPGPQGLKGNASRNSAKVRVIFSLDPQYLVDVPYDSQN